MPEEEVQGFTHIFCQMEQLAWRMAGDLHHPWEVRVPVQSHRHSLVVSPMFHFTSVGHHFAPDTGKCRPGPVKHKHLHQQHCQAQGKINGGVLIAALAKV